tara:strand:- start:453 stop:971 length:519 start_codon:yes stop_codon:yes gene_type:complete
MSESLFDYEEDTAKSYPTYKYDENMKERKNEVRKHLDQWQLNSEILNEGDGENEILRYYYTHPYSKLRFDTIRIEFQDGEEILVPKYDPEADRIENSSYKVIKGDNGDTKLYLSETTYTVRDNEIVRMKFGNYWNTRRGKRYEKYCLYLKKRKEKKRVYDQERLKNQRSNIY